MCLSLHDNWDRSKLCLIYANLYGHHQYDAILKCYSLYRD
nr:MAG TPA: hypothetical protein [Caudoviricetes sp.]